MKVTYLPIFTVIAIFYSYDIAFAQGDVIERQQQERLREQQQRALEALPQKDPAKIEVDRPDLPKIPESGITQPVCHTVEAVIIEGATKFPPSELNRLNKDFIGRCLSIKDIETILAKITKYYIDHGYITTRAYIPAQDLSSGKLKIQILEGRIEGYELQTLRKRAQWAMGAFPGEPGDLLNLRALEQGVDQINSVSSNNASIDLRPGSQEGQTIVVVNNQPGFPLHLYVSGSNLGTESTGRSSASATLTFDSMLGLNEQVSLTHSETIPPNKEHNSTATALSASFPRGYYTFTLGGTQTKYTNMLTMVSGNKLETSGDSTSFNFGISRNIYRSQSSQLSLSSRLNYQSTKSYIGDILLSVSSRKLTTLDTGINGFTIIGGGILNARAGYVQGVPYFESLRDEGHLPDDFPKAQFGKFVFDLGFSRNFNISKTSFLWSSQFSAQRSLDTLYGSQQILIGGPASIAGFYNNTLSGDHGYYWRNSVSIPVKLWPDKNIGMRLKAGFDVGHVSGYTKDAISGTLSGASVGATFQWKTVRLDISTGRSIDKPDYMDKEVMRGDVQLSFSL